MWTSVSIVGYASYVITLEGRIFLIFCLALVTVAVPDLAGQILTLLSSKSIYERRSYNATDNISHIVLIGHVSRSSFLNFLEEYFHADHGDT